MYVLVLLVCRPFVFCVCGSNAHHGGGYLNNMLPSFNFPIVPINNPNNGLPWLAGQNKMNDKGFNDNLKMDESISRNIIPYMSALCWANECF